MIGLPKTTIVDKRIPKEKFYGKLDVSVEFKRAFINQVKSITWRYKIAPTTMNLAPGKQVSEIEVFEVQLKADVLDEAVLRLIDQGIPYHILFLLEYDGKIQAWIAYKEIVNGKVTIKSNAYYQTEWMARESLPLKLDGMDLDAVWENLVTQVGGIVIEDGNSLVEQIADNVQKAKLEKEIARLEKMARNEKQPKKKFEIVQQIQRLRGGNGNG